MTDRPIPFSPAMVCALLDGRKSQTRRLGSSPLAKAQPGDRLWVREAFTAQTVCTDGLIVVYEASILRGGSEAKGLVTLPHGAKLPKRLNTLYPPMHMHRWLSRLTLTVTEVRRQMLHDIDNWDARCEGVEPSAVGRACSPTPYRDAFELLWDELHGAGSWYRGAGLEIVALTFTVAQRNIDA